MKTQIVCLNMSLQSTGKPGVIKGNIIDAIETANTYKFNGKMIKKSKFGIVDSFLKNESPKHLMYYIYCLPKDIVEAQNCLHNTAKEVVNQFREQIDLLEQSLEKLEMFEPKKID